MEKQLAQRIAYGVASDCELDSMKVAEILALKSDPDTSHRRFYVEKAAGVDTGKRKVSGVVMSTETVDRMGDIIKVSGWDVANFKANPQLLWAHDSHSLPIGTPTGVRKGVTAKGLRALMSDETFHSEEENPHAELVFRLVAKGALPGRSVGFRGLDVHRPADDKEREKLGLGRFGVMFRKSELLENSVVPIPANQLALQEKALGFAREVYESGCDDLPSEVVRSVFDSIAFTEQDAERIARDIRRRSIVVPVIEFKVTDAEEKTDVEPEITDDTLVGGGLTMPGDIAVAVEKARADRGGGALNYGDLRKGCEAFDAEKTDPVPEPTLAEARELLGIEDPADIAPLIADYRAASAALDERLAAVGMTRADLADAPPENAARVFGEALQSIGDAHAKTIAELGECVRNIGVASNASADSIADAIEQLKDHLAETAQAPSITLEAPVSDGEADKDFLGTIDDAIKGFSFAPDQRTATPE